MILFCFTVVISLAAGPVYGGGLASQAAHWLVKGGCPEVKKSVAVDTISKTLRLCQAPNPFLSNVSEISAIVEKDQEQALFRALAGFQTEELACARLKIGSLLSDQALVKLTEDFRNKIPVLQAIERRQQEVAFQIRFLNRSIVQTGSVQENLRKIKELETELRQLEAQRRGVYSSIQFSDLPEVKSLVTELIGPGLAPKGFDSYENYTKALSQVKREALPSVENLKERIRASYSLQARQLLDEEALFRKVSIEKDSIPSSDQKYLLASDPLLLQRIQRGTPDENKKAMAALMCRLDAKYGSGTAYLDAAIFGGTALMGGAAGMIAKFSTVRSGFAGGALMARSNGLVSLRAARILQGMSYAGDLGLGVTNAVEACSRTIQFQNKKTNNNDVSASQNTCDGSSGIELIEKDNCLLEAGLTALSTGATFGFSVREVAAFHQTIAGSVSGQAKDLKQNAWRFLFSSERSIHDYRSAVLHPLPKEYVQDLKNSSYVRSLQETYGDGSGMTFKITPYDDNFAQKGELKYRNKIGENTQAVFLKKVLKEIFPKAEVGGSTNAPGAIQLEIADSLEEKSKSNVSEFIEMAKLKMANPGPGAADTQKLKMSLGLKPDTKVISINNSFYNSIDQMTDLVKTVGKSEAQVIILSRGGLSKELIPELISKIKSENIGFEVVTLSELPRKLSSHKKYIVINDTVGKMHVVYGISDLNVTAGAVNLGEPLLARTPSLSFGPQSEYMHGYDQNGFADAVEIAQRAQGLELVESKAQLPDKIKQYLNMPETRRQNIIPPYQVAPDVNSLTPMNQFLGHLQNRIGSQVADMLLWSRLPRARQQEIAKAKLDNLIEAAELVKNSKGSLGVFAKQIPRREVFELLDRDQQQRASKAMAEIADEYLKASVSYKYEISGLIHAPLINLIKIQKYYSSSFPELHQKLETQINFHTSKTPNFGINLKAYRKFLENNQDFQYWSD